MVWFFQSLKNTMPLLWRKKKLQHLSTIEYTVFIRTNSYSSSLESCAWHIAWLAHVLLYKIYIKATITSNQANIFMVYLLVSLTLDYKIWSSIFKSMHLLKRNNIFVLKRNSYVPFCLFVFPFLQMAIIGSRCHLVGEDSLSSWDSPVRRISPTKLLSRETTPCLNCSSPLFQPYPHPSHPLISQDSILQHLCLTQGAGKGQEMASLKEEYEKSVSFNAFNLHTFWYMLYFCYVDLFLPNESV